MKINLKRKHVKKHPYLREEEKKNNNSTECNDGDTLGACAEKRESKNKRKNMRRDDKPSCHSSCDECRRKWY